MVVADCRAITYIINEGQPSSYDENCSHGAIFSGVVLEILRKKIRVHLGGIEGLCFKSFLCCVDLYLIGKTIYCVETPPLPRQDKKNLGRWGLVYRCRNKRLAPAKTDSNDEFADSI